MKSKIVLISDDSNFFEYMVSKLTLRKSDELFRFGFDEIPNKIHLIKDAIYIINSENSKEKTLDLLKLLNDIPGIVFSYNEDIDFQISLYRAGAYACITPMSSEEEIQAKLIPILKTGAILNKNLQYFIDLIGFMC